MHRSGFVALVGRPSAGKSTLLNQLLGQKLAIVSSKPQTTRGRILGIATQPEYQLVLVDTPGLHEHQKGLSGALNEAAEQAAKDVDAVALVVDAAWACRLARQGAGTGDPVDREILERVDRLASGKPIALILNKVDRCERPKLLPVIAQWSEAHHFELVYPLSALTGDNTQGVLAALANLLPEGPTLFPDDQLTDQTERSLVSELIREQVYRLTRAEIPYSVAVEIEEFDESLRQAPKPQKPLVRISAVLFVARDSQKGILIGKRADKLKAIGTSARHEIEKLLGCKVFLGLTVRVESEWMTSLESLRRFGYGPQK